MNGGSIRGCVGTEYAAGGIQNNNNAIMNANGGIVADCTSDNAFYGALLNDGHILVADDARSCTVFEGTARNNGIINGGIFNGAVMNSGGVIGNGTFNGPVTGSGTIKDGTFTATVTRSFFSKEGEKVEITGLGTEALPYQIGTRAQLKLFRDIVNGIENQTSPAACAVLMNDIVLNDGTFDENGNYSTGPSGKAAEEWTPIAYSGPFTVDTTLYYTGTFDGQGHTIKGLYVSINDAPSIEDQVCLGLFSAAKNAVIRNVTVTGYVSGYAGNLGGIVGYLAGGTIENCANYCTVTDTSNAYEVPSYVGGIAGGVNCSATIRDCYNTGTLKEYVFFGHHKTGGIVGYIGSSAVSNCYNVGKVAGKGEYNGEIAGFLAGEDSGETPSTINNCYYLNDAGTAPQARTAAQFADGTVLALLINGRADSAHPWNSECQYLAAAGRTLPVFKGQGDTHTHQSDKWATSETEHWKVCACGAVFDKAAHSGTDDGDCTTAMTCACGHTIAAAKDHTWGAWTSNDDGTHTRRCTISDCTKGTETANCSGGKATCSAKAQCAVCGAAYGPLDPNAHGSGLKHTPARAATTSHQGNIEYWHCANCGKFFSDAAATRVITLADTVIEKLRHSGVTRRYPAATGQPDASGTGKTIKSQDTGDAGVALYAATALLSLTGAAWLTGKKRG